MDKPNTTCDICDKTYKTISNLINHKKNIHNLVIESKNRCKVICTECDMGKFRTFNQLLKHLETEHAFVPCVEEKTFQSTDDFEIWRLEEQNKTCAEFVKSNPAYEFADRTKKWVLHCNRSYNGKPTIVNRKRALKSKGYSKILKTCPARMEVFLEKNENETQVEVIYWKTHLGHECDISHLRIKKPSRLKIARKLKVEKFFTPCEPVEPLDSSKERLKEKLKLALDLVERTSENVIHEILNVVERNLDLILHELSEMPDKACVIQKITQQVRLFSTKKNVNPTVFCKKPIISESEIIVQGLQNSSKKPVNVHTKFDHSYC